MLNIQVGDATDPPRERPRIIVHICNDVGAWGKGFVVALSHRWKQPEGRYRAWFHGEEAQPFALGEVQFVPVEENLWVANLIGQHGLRRRGNRQPVRYDAIRQGLQRVAERALSLGTAVHMPRIGCGLAGGDWEKVEPIVQETLVSQGISVTVYDLPDTLSEEAMCRV